MHNQQLIEWLERLGNPDKHIDVLNEMRPIIDLDANSVVEFEVPGLGGKNIDWLITSEHGKYILLEVKTRVVDLIGHISDIFLLKKVDSNNVYHTSAPNPEKLLKSTNKFNLFSEALRGVWIHMSIKQNTLKLKRMFMEVNHIDFMILADWHKDALILAKESQYIEYLKNIFNLQISNRFETSDYIDSEAIE